MGRPSPRPLGPALQGLQTGRSQQENCPSPFALCLFHTLTDHIIWWVQIQIRLVSIHCKKTSSSSTDLVHQTTYSPHVWFQTSQIPLLSTDPSSWMCWSSGTPLTQRLTQTHTDSLTAPSCQWSERVTRPCVCPTTCVTHDFKVNGLTDISPWQ